MTRDLDFAGEPGSLGSRGGSPSCQQHLRIAVLRVLADEERDVRINQAGPGRRIPGQHVRVGGGRALV